MWWNSVCQYLGMSRLHCFREVKYHLGDTLKIYYQDKTVIVYEMYSHTSSLMVSASMLYYVSLSSFPARTEFQIFISDIVNLQIKTNDGRVRKPNLLYMQFGVLAMPRLKLWIVRGENLIIQLLMATDQLLFACFQPYPRPLLLDEFSIKEMRTQSQTKISSCCLYVWCKTRELGGRGGQDSQNQWWKASPQTFCQQ